MGGKRLVIRDEVPAAELRKLARREPDRAAAARMQAIAGALEGMTRAEAAWLAGMERQALRDAVLRYNAEGLVGLRDRPRPGRASRLDEGRREELRKIELADALPRWNPAAVSLPVLVLAALSAAMGSSQADPQDLSANIPVRIKDAFDSGEFGDAGLYLTERYTQDSKGRYSLVGGPKLKLGVAPGLAVNLLPIAEVGDTRSSRGGFGAAAVEYQLNTQTASLPAVLLEGVYRQPYGDSNSAEYHLIGVATKFLGPSKQSPRLDLELNWGHVTHPLPGDRRDRLLVGIAYSRLLTTRTAIVVDAVRQEQHAAGADESFLDIGINNELRRRSGISDSGDGFAGLVDSGAAAHSLLMRDD